MKLQDNVLYSRQEDSAYRDLTSCTLAYFLTVSTNEAVDTKSFDMTCTSHMEENVLPKLTSSCKVLVHVSQCAVLGIMDVPNTSMEDVGMALRRFGLADYLVFVSMLLICALIGVYYGFCVGKVSETEYLMGGRNMQTFPVALSLIARWVTTSV